MVKMKNYPYIGALVDREPLYKKETSKNFLVQNLTRMLLSMGDKIAKL